MNCNQSLPEINGFVYGTVCGDNSNKNLPQCQINNNKK